MTGSDTPQHWVYFTRRLFDNNSLRDQLHPWRVWGSFYKNALYKLIVITVIIWRMFELC